MLTIPDMLDNMAAASQERVLLEPHVRGAILRAMAGWLQEQGHGVSPTVARLSNELLAHPEAYG